MIINASQLRQTQLTKWHTMYSAAVAKIHAATTQAELDAAQNERDRVQAIKPASLIVSNADINAMSFAKA